MIQKLKKSKIISVLLVCTMLLGITACGKTDAPENSEAVTETETETAITAEGIEVEGLFGDAVKVEIEEITKGDSFNTVKALIGDKVPMAVWDIVLLDKENAKVQPDGSVTITLTLPKELVKAEGDTYTVYRVEDNGTLTKLDSTVEGNVVVFSTEHFSIYAVTKTASQSAETESETPIIEDDDESESEEPSKPEEPSEPEDDDDYDDESGWTINDLNKTMYAKSNVNVRNAPDSSYDKIGSLSKGQEVKVTGQCEETGWYRIEYNGGEGFVSNDYLTDTKPTEPEQPDPPKPDEPVQPDNPEPDEPNEPTYDGYDEFGNGYVIGSDGVRHFDCPCPYKLYSITTYDGQEGYFIYGPTNYDRDQEYRNNHPEVWDMVAILTEKYNTSHGSRYIGFYTDIQYVQWQGYSNPK